MSKRNLRLSLLLTTCYLLLTPSQVLAIDICDYFPPCQSGFATPSDLVNRFVPIAMSLGGIFFFILLIVAGFQVIMHAGSGDAKETEKWRKTLTTALIGFGLIISAFWIVQFIKKLTGVNIPGF